MKKPATLLLSFFLLTFLCCEKDDSPNPTGNTENPVSTTPTTPQPHDPDAFALNFGTEISRTFFGNVIDSNHNPIADATITIDETSVQTDENGIFIIQNATVHERFAYIKAEKSGYINGSRSVVPTSGINNITIMLMKATTVGTTSSGTSETISLSNGASVSLNGEYLKEDGTNYTGDVNVVMHSLDPNLEDSQNQMPGMLYAANNQNQAKALQTYGMLAVELKGSNGETLNLADGSTAEIKIPIDASLIDNLPSTIPLSYFDEVNGYWIEDGVATLIDNSYIGTVSHFTFWNYGSFVDFVSLYITLSNEEGSPISNMRVKLNTTNYFGYTSGYTIGYTNSDGEVSCMAPENETLQISAYTADPFNVLGMPCGIPLSSNSIGPFTEDTSLNITANVVPTSINTEHITGTFHTCEGTPITNGIISFNYNDQFSTYYVTDGNFDFDILRCNTSSNNFILQAYDLEGSQQTAPFNYSFTAPETNMGSLTACSDIEEHLTYQQAGYPEINHIAPFFAKLIGEELIIKTQVPYNNIALANSFQIEISDFTGPGTYTNPMIFLDDENLNWLEWPQEGVTVEVIEFGDVGQYIEIEFEGETDGNITTTITGSIHVIRDM
ncbi:hypothetical protein [Mangrovimonas sp. TPBH4]|uniref:hypothetical protein n=1 Tax=Mangrovimonas sp. TPBH4 TaxID=1645914 RepID=UPI0006B5EDF1|nr:hypothetical protein [Mangrovimonas sp. TPBH4]